MCENLRAEKALLKESEVRLIQENKSLLEHQKSQNAVVTNLQTLQVCALKYSQNYIYFTPSDISFCPFDSRRETFSDATFSNF